MYFYIHVLVLWRCGKIKVDIKMLNVYVYIGMPTIFRNKNLNLEKKIALQDKQLNLC